MLEKNTDYITNAGRLEMTLRKTVLNITYLGSDDGLPTLTYEDELVLNKEVAEINKHWQTLTVT